MSENNKPKMKLWKKILIGFFALIVFVKLFSGGDSSELKKITSENQTLKQENEALKKDNEKLKEEFENAQSTIKMYVEKELENEKKNKPKQENKPANKEASKSKPKENVPREYQNALKTAEQYIRMTPFSKQHLYEQLTSEYGSKFPKEAAQYAIDNLKVDYKEQALKEAKTYMELMPMSDSELFDQLTSEYGGKYTEEEAQYALDNLNWYYLINTKRLKR